jgi:alpha-L-fucosidase
MKIPDAMKTSRVLCYLLFLTMLCPSCQEKKAFLPGQESPEAFNARMEWWRDARFGMFIHWGVYSVPAGIYKGKEVPGIGEWIMNTAQIPVQEYATFARQFNPQKFNADEWVTIAKQAGMKYIVITSKHHDGFCMWDSKVTHYDVVEFSPFGRDVLKALSEACAKQGIRLGFYHSIMDWHNPDARGENFPKYREEYLKPQLKELVKNYDNIGILWFDGEWIDEWTEEQGKDLYAYVRSLKPDIIINNRVGKGRMGMEGMNKGEGYVGDFGTPEQDILSNKSDLDWETCMTMNDTWGYKKNDHNWKPVKELIDNLVDIASKGGNYLLNVGPTDEGLIPQPSIDRLKAVGRWLDINGEAIYGTRAFSYASEGSTRFTRSKDGRYVYAFLSAWPGDSLQLETVMPAVESDIIMLGVEEPLVWKFSDAHGLTVYFPKSLQDTASRPCEYSWVLRMEAKAIELDPGPLVITANKETARKILFNTPQEVSIMPADSTTVVYYTLDGTEPSPASNEYSEAIPIVNSTLLRARAFREGEKQSFETSVQFLNVDHKKIGCINYYYYEGNWDKLPAFEDMEPVRKGLAGDISLHWVSPREEEFGVLFRGILTIPRTGEYTFYLTSDDGSRLYIDSRQVVDHDGLHGMVEKSGTITLKKGKYPIEIPYFEKTGGNGITLFWSGTSLEKQELSAAYLSPNK